MLRTEFFQPYYVRFQSFLQHHLLIAFLAIFVTGAVLKIEWLFKGGPGFDLITADIPKSLLLLKGQDPYAISWNNWQSPYPPFLLIVDAALIRLTSHGISNPTLIAWNLRAAGFVAEMFTGLFIFLVLRSRTVSWASILVPTAVFFFDPTISSQTYFFFHSDVFGILILAGSMFAFVKERYVLGIILLGVATIFKVHPAVSLFLISLWLVRKNGFRKSLLLLMTGISIVMVGLILPFWIPGYEEAFIGFNLQNGADAHGMNSLTLMNFFYGVLPTFWNITVPSRIVNYVWIAITMSLLVPVIGFVWRKFDQVGPVEVAVLGLLVWFLPLRHLYNDYLIWMLVPLFMLGRVRLTLIVAVIFEMASIMANSVWLDSPSLIPGLHGPLGFFATSIVLALCSIVSLLSFFVSRGTRGGPIIPGEL